MGHHPHLGPAARGEVFGRAAEASILAAVVGRLSQSGAALVVTGDAGVGKSRLLQAAADDAAAGGAMVLRAAGVGFESDVAYAGLNQLLLPLVDDLAGLSTSHREALLAALGLGAGPTPRVLLASAAVLRLLQRAADGRPVLVVVDDLPSLDPASAQVLGLLIRRLTGSSIGFLGAARTGADCVLLQAGVPQLEVLPLAEEAAADLLDARAPGLEPSVRRRILSASAGNPLALVELPAVLTEAQRAGRRALPPTFPLSGPLQEAFGRPVAALPSRTRRLLLLAALDGTGDLRTLRAAAADDRWLDDLAPAEEGRLVRVDLAADRIMPWHPLIGTAAVATATTGGRRDAHRALAGVLVDRPDECAWHLAEAAVGPDAAAADLLESVARAARGRGDGARATEALIRAAELSPDGAARARRLAMAAFLAADTTGDLLRVPELLAEARRADPGAATSLEVAVASAHHLLHADGDVATAHLVLVPALRSALDDGATEVEDALHVLAQVCHAGGRDELWRPFEAALRVLGPDVPPVLAVTGMTLGDPVRATPAALGRLDELVAAANAGAASATAVRVGIAATYAGRLSGCREALRRVVRDGESGGAAASAVTALVMLSREALDTGRWDEAQRWAEQGIEWGEELGYRLLSHAGVHCLGLLAAMRGDDREAEDLADQLVRWSAPRGVHLLEHAAHRIRGVAALGRGDVEAAYRQFVAIGPAGGFAPHAPIALTVAMDVVEAAVRTGRDREAAAHAAATSRTAIAEGGPSRPVLVAAGCAALVAAPDEAPERFERALGVRGAENYPFERARIQLAHGEHLRRTRATSASREQLSAALETFRHLGARPWADRAWSELRATGLVLTPAQDRTFGGLTTQEYQVAMLAASGLSNKQIGNRLYLSPRTVGAHLYRLFPKLGVTSRAALRDALGAVEASSTAVL